MKDNNDKYIQDLFDSDGIRAPESLSEENMLKMLRDADAAAEKDAAGNSGGSHGSESRFRKARPSAKKLVTIAASVMIAVFGIAGFTAMMNKAPDTSVRNGELYTFKSESEIKRTIKSLEPSRSFKVLRLGNNDYSEEIREYDSDMTLGTEDAEAFDSAEPSVSSKSLSAAGKSEGAGESHSSTYLQVDDVDEADIVKTDGKYIYYVNTRKEVVILSAKDGKTEKVSVIGSSGVENYIHDIYLKGDTLVTVGKFYSDDDDEGSSGIVIYDISDRSKPEVVNSFRQTGEILSSRMVGDYVYLVTNDYVSSSGRIVPMCGCGDEYDRLSVSDISCVPHPGSSSYIVLSAVDISSGKQGRSATKAIFGSTEEIYCNNHNLYTTSWEWNEDQSTACTRIVRASLDGLKVKFNATASVRGYIQSQFAMDEKDGYFRIATTSERDGIDVNNLFVLDGELKETGKVSGFARDESIKSVRYMGDKAYVITYQQIDPLFIIDLSDPAAPRIEGEVKIDGFSSLLVPISGSRLLGIGHATGDNGYGGEYDSGLKLALFDISDPSEPKVLASKEFEDMSSQAQYDHHALTVNSEAGYFAIPYDIYRYDDSDVIVDDESTETVTDTHEAGVLVFKAGDKITDIDQHALGSESLLRSVYIGDYIYALDGDGNAKSFRPAV